MQSKEGDAHQVLVLLFNYPFTANGCERTSIDSPSHFSAELVLELVRVLKPNSQRKVTMGTPNDPPPNEAPLFADLTSRHCASDTDHTSRPPSLHSLAATSHTLIGDDGMISAAPARHAKVFANLMSGNRAAICN
jgi:hypothetical protein